MFLCKKAIAPHQNLFFVNDRYRKRPFANNIVLSNAAFPHRQMDSNFGACYEVHCLKLAAPLSIAVAVLCSCQNN